MSRNPDKLYKKQLQYERDESLKSTCFRKIWESMDISIFNGIAIHQLLLCGLLETVPEDSEYYWCYPTIAHKKINIIDHNKDIGERNEQTKKSYKERKGGWYMWGKQIHNGVSLFPLPSSYAWIFGIEDGFKFRITHINKDPSICSEYKYDGITYNILKHIFQCFYHSPNCIIENVNDDDKRENVNILFFDKVTSMMGTTLCPPYVMKGGLVAELKL